MKVILLKEVKGKGGEGDVIEVARGYANNYLLTQGYAVKASKGNLKQLEQRKNNIAKREEVRIANANELAENLNDAKINVVAKVGEEGQLFGSVTSSMIADAINSQFDIEIDKHRVELHKPIKAVGEYPVEISIYRNIKATVNVVVAGELVKESPEEDEANGENGSAESVEGAQADAEQAGVEQADAEQVGATAEMSEDAESAGETALDAEAQAGAADEQLAGEVAEASDEVAEHLADDEAEVKSAFDEVIEKFEEEPDLPAGEEEPELPEGDPELPEPEEEPDLPAGEEEPELPAAEDDESAKTAGSEETE